MEIKTWDKRQHRNNRTVATASNKPSAAWQSKLIRLPATDQEQQGGAKCTAQTFQLRMYLKRAFNIFGFVRSKMSPF